MTNRAVLGARALLGLLLVVAASAQGLPVVTGADTAPVAGRVATTVHLRLRTAVQRLPVAAETPAGYARSRYRLWVDADSDCRDTRDEVLASESKVVVTGCDIRTGRWVSYYDRRTWTDSSDVDIDHLVPLKESWDSGAKTWNADTRMRFANDLGDSRTLVAVTDDVNQSKGDRDPAQWMPRYGTCTYVRQWTAVKIRWDLKVDKAEKAALVRSAAGCRNRVIAVRKASVVRSHTSAAAPSAHGLDPHFDTCADAIAHGFGPYRDGSDPEYDWYRDGDGDGVVCE